MDLNSLLNNQKDTRLSLNDLQQLLAQGDSVVIFEKIQNSTAYDLPINRADTFVFFDTFIQVILSIIHDDDPYSAQLSKSIVIDSLRSCINGLLRQNGIEWLIEFPSYFSTKTWVVLRANITILVYLYGLVLAIWNKPELIRHREEWMKGILQFVHSNSPIVMLHLWLNCCCMLNQDVNTTSDAEELYLVKVEAAYSNGKLAEDAVITMIRMLQELQVDVLAEQVNQQLGSALARPPFTKDEFIVGKICLDNACNSRSNRYTSIRKIYQQMQAQTALEHATSGEASNPLLSTDILASTPADKYLQTEAIRKATLFWLQKMGALYPHEFDLHLKEAIQSHYPTDRKTILDLALADWTARDRFHRHLGFVMDVIIAQLQKSRYNRRTSPYYAFVQLFNIPDDHQQQQQQQTSDISLNDSSTSYQTKSGAYIDLSEFSNCSDVVLMDGCCSILQKLTLSGNSSSVEDWVADCLQSASADIVKRYAEWLAQGLEKELITKQTPFRFTQYTKVLLKTCVSQSAHVVPTLLHTFSDHGLEWLLKKNTSFATILLHYFDDGPQVSKDIVVRTLFTSKSKVYMDQLLAYLRQHMSGTDPKLPRSRSWFRNHFLSNLLLLVGEDTKGKTVASGVFRQLLKTRSDFEWYFATPLVSTQQMTFSTLDLCSTHDVYAIKHTGLAALLQEMVRLGDGAKKERLIKVWSDLWTLPRTNNDYKFTVPVSWVLQCAGLYDQAPVLVKQMIKKFLTIGIHQSTLAAAAAAADQGQSILPTAPGRTFLERVMDLILLSDTPEPDSLFELVLNVYYSQEGSRTFGDINWTIIHILVELAEELEVEMLVLASASNLPPPRPNPKKIYKKRNKKYNKKQHMSRLKLGATMKKHEEELEKYFQELSDNTSKINNAIKALTTLVQRVFNFLLRLLNDSSTFSTVDSNNSCLSIKQDIQRELVEIPLFYEPLAKLDKLISEPEDLHEDIQTVIELSVECLKKKADQALYEASQKILLATS
ncbi:Glycerol-3-phosphate/dihydroxyacetone phosphate acyltransferase [Mucor velutinosus]|uniref:Glycerol-3-phosphate/dihydroxyacetone phosphate acyltransferase n=1 Tax=Mucor velutinosus TaxID=708070 RepID=A0AAN7HZZ9_9FUNG|nr:Glycerol-3-phosphate/dihydroxyacetone phosphate acyltransferase [Mucor velutinosus]